jgi:penicillin-binding protein 1A
VRALTANARAGGVVQGGSTITQQLAKNLFLNNERTIERKVKEAFLAIWLETRLTKNEILKLYLDRAYMGGGAFGVDAAAQYYFNKSAQGREPVRSRDARRPVQGADALRAARQPAGRPRARQHGARQSVEAGFMTEGQVFGARRNPATALGPARRARRQLLSRLRLRRDEEAGRDLPEVAARARLRGAHRPRRQSAARAENAIESMLRQYGADYRVKQAGTVVLESRRRGARDGRRRDYGQSQFNRATDALRQPGLLVQAIRLRDAL